MSEESVTLRIDDIERVQQRPVYVYLASPLTSQSGRRQAQNRRARLAIKQELSDCPNAFFEVYDPADHTQPGSAHSADEVYRIDYCRTITADLLILHVNAASIGLGIEAQLGTDAGVPRVIVSPMSMKISRMLLGIPAKGLGLLEYRDISDLKLKLRKVLPDWTRRIVAGFPSRRRALEAVRDAKIGRFVLRMRIRHGIPRAELADRALLSEEHVRCIELFDECAICLTLIQSHQLAEALNCKFRPLRTDVPMFEPNRGLPGLLEVDRESLDSLIDFVVRRDIRNDQRVFELWDHYMEMRSKAIAGREPLGEPMTEDDWEHEFRSGGTLF